MAGPQHWAPFKSDEWNKSVSKSQRLVEGRNLENLSSECRFEILMTKGVKTQNCANIDGNWRMTNDLK